MLSRRTHEHYSLVIFLPIALRVIEITTQIRKDSESQFVSPETAGGEAIFDHEVTEKRRYRTLVNSSMALSHFLNLIW